MSKQLIERSQVKNSSKSKRMAAILSIGMFWIAMASTQASAQSATPAKASTRFSGQATVTDSCTGETIPMNVDLFVSVTLVNNSETTRAQSHFDLRGTGTGSPSGTFYSLQSVEDAEGDLVLDDVGNFNLTLVGDAVLISHGSAPNELIHEIVHILVTPDLLRDLLNGLPGQPKVTVDFTTNCRG